MKKKLVGMLATATLLTMALAGNVQAAEIRSVGPDGEAAVDASTIELTDDQIRNCSWRCFRRKRKSCNGLL